LALLVAAMPVTGIILNLQRIDWWVDETFVGFPAKNV